MTAKAGVAAKPHVVREGELLWTPRPEFARQSNLTRYMKWLADHRGLAFLSYDELWRWSVNEIESFWASIWDYHDVISTTPYKQVLDQRVMPGAKWFEGSQVNYAEHLLRHEAKASAGEAAILHCTEARPLARMSWQELGRQVRIVATQLRAMGVQPGDRVVAYLPNIPEATVAMIATLAVGAVWSSCAPEFGVKVVIERYAQIQPKVFISADGYRFGGKTFDRTAEAQQIVDALPSLTHTVWLNYLNPEKTEVPLRNGQLWSQLLKLADIPREKFSYARVPYDHPIWVVFSSGTTGLPKAIVHSHVGTLTEHFKLSFHLNLRPGSVMFFYTTTGWMMYNLLVSALLSGSAIVQYDGNPAHPGPDFLWQLAAQTRATNFGASPTFVQMMEKAGLRPGEKFDLSALDSILVAGSPSTPETFEWFYRCVKQDLWVTSQSGGTELCSGFVGAAPTLPVYAGEIQTRLLGMDIHAWSDEGKEVHNEVGEMVCTSPFPSMPIYFWNDKDGQRYHDAYFAVYSNVWRHGDFIKINERGGCYIYGRSDSTLNRYGVRIGTAEIYRCVEQIPAVLDSLVVCVELPGGKFFMPMFVKLKPDVVLDEKLQQEIATRLRNDCSPRHIPDKLYAVEAIPYTLTGKKMEVPVRKLLVGTPLEKSASRDAMMNPSAIDWFVRFAQESKDYQWRS